MDYKKIIDRIDNLKEKKTKLSTEKDLLEKKVKEYKEELAGLGISSEEDLSKTKEKLTAKLIWMNKGLDEIEKVLNGINE